MDLSWTRLPVEMCQSFKFCSKILLFCPSLRPMFWLLLHILSLPTLPHIPADVPSFPHSPSIWLFELFVSLLPPFPGQALDFRPLPLPWVPRRTLDLSLPWETFYPECIFNLAPLPSVAYLAQGAHLVPMPSLPSTKTCAWLDLPYSGAFSFCSPTSPLTRSCACTRFPLPCTSGGTSTRSLTEKCYSNLFFLCSLNICCFLSKLTL